MSQAVNFKFGQLLYDRWMTNFNKYKDAFIHNTDWIFLDIISKLFPGKGKINAQLSVFQWNIVKENHSLMFM